MTQDKLLKLPGVATVADEVRASLVAACVKAEIFVGFFEPGGDGDDSPNTVALRSRPGYGFAVLPDHVGELVDRHWGKDSGFDRYHPKFGRKCCVSMVVV